MKNSRLLVLLMAGIFCLAGCNQMAGSNPKDDLQNNSDAEKKEYTVSFSENIPDSTEDLLYFCSAPVPVSKKITEGQSFTLPDFDGILSKYVNTILEGEYAFDSWNTAADGSGQKCTPGSSFTVTEDTIFYAVYSSTKINSGEDSGNNPDENSDPSGGNSVEYNLCGTWRDADSYITLNSDKTGYMKVYLNDDIVQDCSFNWSAYENSYGIFMTITNGPEYINKTYTIEKISASSMTLNGYLAFGKPKVTTWTKDL